MCLRKIIAQSKGKTKMEFSGRFKSMNIDYETGETILAFATSVRPVELAEEIAKIKERPLDVKAAVHRNKRSINANAYFHVLVGKIADKLNLSKTRCKNVLISRYGQMLYVDEQPVVIKTQIPIDYMLEQELVHSEPCGSKIENGMSLNYYHIFRASHTYDTNEMAILINGTVEEAKELGIETLTPDEILRMESMWHGEK